MSTLRVSNIEAKAFPSSPTVDEKVKVTNSSGDILLHLDGTTSGIGTVGIGTTGTTFRVDPNQTVTFPGNVISSGIITASSLSGNLTGNVTGNVTGTVTQLSTNATGANLTLTGNLGVGGTITYEDVARVDATGVSTFREGLKVGPLTGIALTAYTDGSIRSTGIITATSFSGSGTNLTSLPAAQLTGTLPAIDGSSLTGVGVGTADNINTSGIVTAKAFIPSSGQLGHRNILVNGAMNVAQRGTSSTSGGFQTVDRWQVSDNNTNVTITQGRHAVTSSDTGPWELGFRNAYQITLSAAGNSLAGDSGIWLVYGIEAQDLAYSGWDYTNPNSFLTLSFWVKVSTNQTFYGHLRTKDGTEQGYPFSFTASGNNTWTKITQSIPGFANLQFDNNENIGCQLQIIPYHGANFSTSGRADKTWAAHASGSYTDDMANTWITAGTSTFAYTGIQLEVGSVATPFEHISYGEDVKRCQRYFFSPSGAFPMFADRTTDAHNCGRTGMYWFNQPMRSSPTMSNMSMTVYTGSAQTLQAYSVTPDYCWFNHTGSFSDGRAWAKINSFKADAEI